MPQKNVQLVRFARKKRKRVTFLSTPKQKLVQISRGLKSSPEIKGIIINYTGTMTTTGNIREVSSVITQGLGVIDRVGAVITAKGLQYKGTILHNATSANPVSFRVIFYVTRNANGVTPLVGSVLSPTNSCGMLPLISYNNIIILKDHFLSLNPPIAWNGSATFTTGATTTIEGFVSLKDLPISYLGNSGLPSSANMNSITMLVIADVGSVLDYCISAKLTYTDA